MNSAVLEDRSELVVTAAGNLPRDQKFHIEKLDRLLRDMQKLHNKLYPSKEMVKTYRALIRGLHGRLPNTSTSGEQIRHCIK
jgi:hypothetical protein